jgi:hypothetical protein
MKVYSNFQNLVNSSQSGDSSQSVFNSIHSAEKDFGESVLTFINKERTGQPKVAYITQISEEKLLDLIQKHPLLTKN